MIIVEMQILVLEFCNLLRGFLYRKMKIQGTNFVHHEFLFMFYFYFLLMCVMHLKRHAREITQTH